MKYIQPGKIICPHCTSSKVSKNGIRINKKDEVQEWKCQNCGKYFRTPLEDPNSDLMMTEDVEPGKILECKFDKDIRIHGATDVHFGALEHHSEKFQDFIDEIDADPNARWFLNGDNIELIPPNYKISQRGQIMEPDDQHIKFIKRITPIIDKLLFIRGGNHDMIRSINLLGFDVSKIMADMVNVPYFKLPGYTKISVGGTDWYMVSGHGKGGGKNGDLELDKMSAVYSDGDAFFLGHNHQLYTKPIDSLIVDGDEERLHRRWYCRGGSFLKYAEYARYSFFPMIRTGWVTMEFREDEIRAWTN
jgi:predicted phosphodiesterase/ribosomal protein L37AE/L43A